MKRYIALLRAINVSGKNMIPMADLKTGFEETGYRNVKTLLNSGNVVFDAEERPEPVLAEALSSMIRDRYALDVPVFVILREDLRDLLKRAPSWWGTDDKAVYDNLIFLLHGSRPKVWRKLRSAAAPCSGPFFSAGTRRPTGGKRPPCPASESI